MQAHWCLQDAAERLCQFLDVGIYDAWRDCISFDLFKLGVPARTERAVFAGQIVLSSCQSNVLLAALL